MRIALLFLVIVFISVATEIHARVKGRVCPVSSLKQCVNDLTNLTSQVQIFFPTMTQEEYTTVCQNYKINELCLTAFQRVCNEEARFPISNEVNLMEFLCHGREDEYKDFGPTCFASIPLRAEIMLCSKAYIGKPQEILAKSPSKEERAKFCSLSRDVLYCRYLTVEDHCGTEAARWQHMAHVASLSIPLKKSRCKYTLDVDFEVERVTLRVVFGVTICLLLVCAFPARMIFCPRTKQLTSPLQKKTPSAYTINGDDDGRERPI